MVRRVLAEMVRPFFRLLVRALPVDDPWQRIDVRIPVMRFGSGMRRDFGWVFDGESAVEVGDLDAVLEWLRGCEYASDPHLFQEPDYWQHPRTFEHLRRGDCEDFALWAWRKLVELGYDADLIVGRRVPPVSENSRHAWLVLRREGGEFVLEPVRPDPDEALRPLAEVKSRYIPEFGVGRDRKSFAFAGFLYFLKHPHLGKPRAPNPGSMVEA